MLDDDGILQMGWKNVRGSSDSIKDYMYFGSDGKAKIGWYSIEPPEDLEGYDGDVEWFYFAIMEAKSCRLRSPYHTGSDQDQWKDLLI